MDILYLGEHIFAGRTGNLSTMFGFLFALAACILFFAASLRGKNHDMLIRLARLTYLGHFCFLVLAIGTLYYLIFDHAFEFQYIYQYSSKGLPFHFLASCFWAGQEGSILIWAFFQGVLALFVMKSAGDKESPAMGLVAAAQVFLLMMILGWKTGGIEIGSSPFTLIRNMKENFGDEFFSNANYVSLITDGNGLNPLLQNFWMVIHPPLLFLGYAMVLIPFSFAFAGLVNRDYGGWLKPALPWALLAALTLGLGIILGGAWAYVDLTFGGFWAWDPVENASLVPWLTMIATIHLILLSRKYKHNLQWAFVMTGISYTMVIYASFLTRSGILKESSAHAFGEEGKAFLLVAFTLFSLMLSLAPLIFHRPRQAERNKESLSSREFWMFTGCVILILSAFQIIITTSIPVFNKVFGINLAPPANSIEYYNQWQLPFCILIILLAGFTLHLKYGKTNIGEYFRKTAIPAAISFICIIIAIFAFPFDNPLHFVLLFCTIYLISITTGQLPQKSGLPNNTGAIISHLGLALFILGILLAFSHENVISGNQYMQTGSDRSKSNQILNKGEPSKVGTYKVVYSSHTKEGNYYHFNLDFYKGNEKGKSYTLSPVINKSSGMGDVYEPFIRHQFTRDIYAVVSYSEALQSNHIEGFTKLSEYCITQGETKNIGDYILYFDSLNSNLMQRDTDSAVITAYLRVVKGDTTHKISPAFIIKNGVINHSDVKMVSDSTIFRFERVSQQIHEIVIGVYKPGKEYIVVKVMVFPWIIILWLGAAVMFCGFLITILKCGKKTAGNEPESVVSLQAK